MDTDHRQAPVSVAMTPATLQTLQTHRTPERSACLSREREGPEIGICVTPEAHSNWLLCLSNKPFQLEINQDGFPLSPLVSNKSPASRHQRTDPSSSLSETPKGQHQPLEATFKFRVEPPQREQCHPGR